MANAELSTNLQVEKKAGKNKVNTFDILDSKGRLKAFEISSGIGRRRVSKVIRDIPNTSIIRVTSGFSWNFIVPNRDDVVCEFEFESIKFKISEDWGDSSRYWIGPQDYEFHPQTEVIKEAFTKFS